MYLNIAPTAHAGSTNSTNTLGFPGAPNNATTAASSSEAETFANSLSRREAAGEANAADTAKSIDAIDADNSADDIASESRTKSHRRRSSSSDTSGDATDNIALPIAIAPIPPRPAPSVDAPSLSIPASRQPGDIGDLPTAPTVPTMPAMPDMATMHVEATSASIPLRFNVESGMPAPSATPPASPGQPADSMTTVVDDAMQNSSADTIADTGDAKIIGGKRTGTAEGMFAKTAANANGTSQAAQGSTQTTPATQATQTTQALLSEFENSINHFERAGNSWVGHARIAFQSSVLHGASVQISSDGKSLSVLLSVLSTQSELAPMAFSLQRQEQQLSETLTRKLGRAVTLRVATNSGIQAADDVDPQ
jgi:hypothetical protein